MLAGKEVIALIPQKPPMVMVDSLLSSDEKKTVTSLTIKPDNVFCENGFFSEAGLMENIAQSAALRSGYHFSKAAGVNAGQMKPPVGFIGGIKNFKLHFLPESESIIQTEITLLHEFGDVSVISGRIEQEGKPVIECEMKIFLKKK